MLQFYNTYKLTKYLMICVFIIFTSCNIFKKNEENNNNIIKKKRVENNVIKRSEQNAERGLTLFGKKSDDTKLGNSNVMWRATLDVLNIFPMSYASFSGGIISTDWYSSEVSNDSIKVEVRFLSSEVKVSSVKVTSYKKKCLSTNNCKIIKMEEGFNKKIHSEIFKKITSLNIDKETN